jgi:hypothetical protein
MGNYAAVFGSTKKQGSAEMSQVASRCMHRLEEHIRLPCGARYDTGKEAHD